MQVTHISLKIYVCFCLSKPFPTSLPLPLQPLSREVKARCTQTHPDAFNLSKWVTSVHMFRFLAWTMGKRLAFYFGQKLKFLTLDPKVTSRALPGVPASLLVPRIWLSITSEGALTTAAPCRCCWQHELPWGHGCTSPSCRTRVQGHTGREATGQGGKLSAGTEGWQPKGICSPWLGLDYTPRRSCEE